MSRLKVDRIETTNAGSLKIAPSVAIQNSTFIDRVIINGNDNGHLSVTCPIRVGTTMVSVNAGQIGQVLTSQGEDVSPQWKDVGELPLYHEFPIGGIVMWSGSLSTIPSGYKLCDGTQYGTVKTPNLTDRFIIGASPTNNVNATGGTKDAVVVAHSHTITDPGHRHKLPTDGTLGSVDQQSITATANSDEAFRNYSDFAATGIIINSAGESGVNKNLPPYYALYYIMRVSY